VSVGVDLFRVQQLLGHKTTKMTLRYAHMRPDDLRDAVRQMESGMREKAEQSNIIPMKRTG
jgi:site-specific recombinase XerD